MVFVPRNLAQADKAALVPAFIVFALESFAPSIARFLLISFRAALSSGLDR